LATMLAQPTANFENLVRVLSILPAPSMKREMLSREAP
jgi:hypothetical protein